MTGSPARRWRTGWRALLGALLALGVGVPAHALEVAAVAVDGPLVVGVPGRVWVAVTDAVGRPLQELPTVAAEAARARPLAEPTPPGVFALAVTALRDEPSVALTVSYGARSRTVRVPVDALPLPPFELARAVVADVGQPLVRIPLKAAPRPGAALPPVEALSVAVSEGRLVGVERGPDDTLVIVIAPEISPYPRTLAVVVRDGRGGTAPALGAIKLRATLDVPVTTEPGARVTVSVGGRVYGPVVADASGEVTLTVEQLPDESAGRIEVVDEAGNVTARPFTLAAARDAHLVPLVAGPRLVGEPPPMVFLAGLSGTGRIWRREAPSCRVPGQADLQVTPVDDGLWLLALPDVDPRDIWELRVRCALGDEAAAAFGVPLADAVPAELSLRVFPEVLRADFPVADVQVALLNGTGERIPFKGDVTLEAELGGITREPGGGTAVRAEYRGDIAVPYGEDRVRAQWYAAPGSGAVDRVGLWVPSAPDRGPLVVVVRALDRARRPLRGVAASAWADGEVVTGETGPRGFATFTVPAGDGPIVAWTARVGGREVRGLAVRDTVSASPTTAPDLFAEAVLRVDRGQGAELRLEASARRITAGSRRGADVFVQLLDNSGLPADDSGLEVSASEGALLRVPATDDDAGTRFRFVPTGSFAARDVTVTAREPAIEVETDLTLRVRPKVIRGGVMGAAGVTSNFGPVVAPLVSLDVDVALPLAAARRDDAAVTRFLLRAGLSWWRVDQAVAVEADATPDGGQLPTAGRVTMHLLPFTAAALVRRRLPKHAFWGGIGFTLPPYVGRTRFVVEDTEVLVDGGGGVLPPGVVFIAGYGLRVPGGELALELRGNTLSSPGGPFAVSGLVGGLSATVGYRILF